MEYRTPEALEMAVKAAAKESSLDTGRAVSGFYFHRLLCRVFSQSDSRFVLKGGQSMLARTVDARATRDIDLLAEKTDIDSALAELKALAAIDLGDFVTYEFVGVDPIKDDGKLVRGTKLLSELSDMGRAEGLAALFFDPVLSKDACGRLWKHEDCRWK